MVSEKELAKATAWIDQATNDELKSYFDAFCCKYGVPLTRGRTIREIVREIEEQRVIDQDECDANAEFYEDEDY